MRRQQRERKSEDVAHPLNVRLEDLYKGAVKKLQLTKNVICSTCTGKGSTKENAVKSCSGCRGQGIRIVMRQLGPGMVQQMQVKCPDCDGQGEIIKDSDRCPKCKGEKTVQEKKVLEVQIEKGMQHGQKIPFRGEADQKVCVALTSPSLRVSHVCLHSPAWSLETSSSFCSRWSTTASSAAARTSSPRRRFLLWRRCAALSLC